MWTKCCFLRHIRSIGVYYVWNFHNGPCPLSPLSLEGYSWEGRISKNKQRYTTYNKDTLSSIQRFTGVWILGPPDQHISQVTEVTMLLVLHFNQSPFGLSSENLLPIHSVRAVATKHSKWDQALNERSQQCHNTTGKCTMCGVSVGRALNVLYVLCVLCVLYILCVLCILCTVNMHCMCAIVQNKV